MQRTTRLWSSGFVLGQVWWLEDWAQRSQTHQAPGPSEVSSTCRLWASFRAAFKGHSALQLSLPFPFPHSWCMQALSCSTPCSEMIVCPVVQSHVSYPKQCVLSGSCHPQRLKSYLCSWNKINVITIMLLPIYLLYYTPDSQGVPNIVPNCIPHVTSVLWMMTSVTLTLCHAPSGNYIYISQMILHRLEVVFETVLHIGKASQKGQRKHFRFIS